MNRTNNYKATLEFIEIFDMFTILPCNFTIETIPYNRKTAQLRYNLIHEEFNELKDAIRDRNFIEVIDALTDILYVVYGAGATFALNLESSFKDYLTENNLINTLNNNNDTHFTYFTQNKDSFVPNVDFFNNSDDMEFINKQISSMELGLKNLETILVNHIGCEGLQNSLHFFNYCVYLIGVYLQIDLDRSFDIVHSSNMSKVCNSQEEAEKTKEWYLNNEKRYDSPTVFESTKFKGKYLVRNASTGKALKNINYTAANFSSMLPQ